MKAEIRFLWNQISKKKHFQVDIERIKRDLRGGMNVE